MARKPPKGKSLAEVNPELAKQWHPTKNGDLTPSDFFTKSGIKVWWKCDKGNDHVWLTSPNERNRGRGCPICSGSKIVNSNCLSTTHPKLAEQWHPIKNIDLNPTEISIGSHKKIWWKCNKGVDHEWEASTYNRLRADCPICSGKKTVKSNTLFFKHPQIAKKWHPTKNGDLKPSDIYFGSGKKVWWKCDKGEDHEFFSSVGGSVRSGVNYCPFCSGRQTSKKKSLEYLFPKIANQWHPSKNGNDLPIKFTSGSNKRIWWKCKNGEDHEWVTSIEKRTSGRECPFCSHQRLSITNCLETINPELSKEWNYDLNLDITPKNVSPNTEKKVWWTCLRDKNHIWEAYIHVRNRGTSCPYCTLTPQSKQELTITFELIQFFKDINPRGFKTKINGKVRSVDIYIPCFQLAIEFDGSYWHKGKREFDKLKTIQLKEEGLDVIRIREQSKAATLKKITKNDVISKMPFNGKKVANNVLRQIMKMYELDTKKIAKIESYIAKNELQNEKGLDKYIDMILTEKAEKKN
jgi:hypothetical protein